MDDILAPGPAGDRPDLPEAGPFGRALKAHRLAAAMSQRALARASGVQQGRISELESGAVTVPDSRIADALAKALGCTADALLRGEEPSSPADASPTSPADATGTQHIPHSRLKRSNLNPRKVFDESALDDLAASILEDTILQNLLVRPDPAADGDYLVIAGERRWRAAGINIERGHWPTDHPVPCRVVDVDEAKHRLLAIVENLQRVDVDPLDEAEAYREMLAYGEWDTTAIATAIGKSPRHVQLRLALVNRLDETAQQALRNGDINLAAARALTAAPLVLQREMLDRIGRGDPSLRKAEDIATQIRASVFPAKRALFPLTSYTGETTTDAVTGETLLLDVEQARALQMEAIDQKIAELQGRFDWVNVMRHNDWWTPGGGDRIVYAADRPIASSDQMPLGAVVRVAGNLEVTIFQDLVSVPRPIAPPAEDAATPAPAASPHPNWSPAFPTAAPATADPVAAMSMERRALALRAKTRALQTALFVHQDAWAHQLILALLGCRDLCGIAAPPPRPENATVAAEVAAVLHSFRDQLGGDGAFLPMSSDWPYLSLARDDDDGQTTSTTQAALTVLPRLQALPTEESFRLLAALTASRCATPWLPMRQNLGDGPLVVATAAAVGADVALHGPVIDAEYVAMLNDEQLDRLALTVGATTDIEEFALLHLKQQEQRIVDHVRANDVRHVPPEFRFSPPSGIEAALRAEAESEPEAASTCTITGLDKLLPPDLVERLSVAVAAHPDFGLIGLPLEFGGGQLLLMKEPHLGGPVIYSAETFGDGFGSSTSIDTAPAEDVRRFVEWWLKAASPTTKGA